MLLLKNVDVTNLVLGSPLVYFLDGRNRLFEAQEIAAGRKSSWLVENISYKGKRQQRKRNKWNLRLLRMAPCINYNGGSIIRCHSNSSEGTQSGFPQKMGISNSRFVTGIRKSTISHVGGHFSAMNMLRQKKRTCPSIFTECKHYQTFPNNSVMSAKSKVRHWRMKGCLNFFAQMSPLT